MRFFIAAFLLLFSFSAFANPHLGHAAGYLTNYCADDAPAQPPASPGCVEIPGEPLPFNAEAGLVRLSRLLPNQITALQSLGAEQAYVNVLARSFDDVLMARSQVAIASAMLQAMRDYGTTSVANLQEVRRLLNSPNNREAAAANERISNVVRGYGSLIFVEPVASLTFGNGVTVYHNLAGTQFYANHVWKTLQLAIWHVDDAIMFELERQ